MGRQAGVPEYVGGELRVERVRVVVAAQRQRVHVVRGERAGVQQQRVLEEGGPQVAQVRGAAPPPARHAAQRRRRHQVAQRQRLLQHRAHLLLRASRQHNPLTLTCSNRLLAISVQQCTTHRGLIPGVVRVGGVGRGGAALVPRQPCSSATLTAGSSLAWCGWAAWGGAGLPSYLGSRAAVQHSPRARPWRGAGGRRGAGRGCPRTSAAVQQCNTHRGLVPGVVRVGGVGRGGAALVPRQPCSSATLTAGSSLAWCGWAAWGGAGLPSYLGSRTAVQHSPRARPWRGAGGRRGAGRGCPRTSAAVQ
ncbi:hypothetical protein ACJJTC_008578 [Scirpophaga incertulas]